MESRRDRKAFDEGNVAASVEALLAERAARGRALTMPEINAHLARRNLSDAELVAVWQRLRTQGACREEVPVDDSRYFLESTLSGAPREEAALAAYLFEIGRRRVLTREEELALFRVVRAGRAAARALAESGVSSPELDRAATEANQARRRILEASLRLVAHVARPYARLSRTDLLDLIQEGTLGLFEALERFDPDRGFRFATYATWWVRTSIQRSLQERGRLIRLPDHVHARMQRLRRRRRELAQSLGRPPREEELARDLGLAIIDLELLLAVERDAESLDLPLAGEDEATLHDVVPDEHGLDPARETGRIELPEKVRDVLDDLDERERLVLSLRYGLDGHEPESPDRVAVRLGVTPQRVGQLERRALERLAHPSRSGSLSPFLED